MRVIKDVSARNAWDVGLEPLQRPVDDWVTRSVPFPFPRNACAIIAGPANLDYGSSKDLCADTHWSTAGIGTDGFEADTGLAFDERATDCYNLGFSWIDVPSDYWQSVEVAALPVTMPPEKFNNSQHTLKIGSKFLTPDTKKFLPTTKMACWIGGIRLKTSHDYNVSISMKEGPTVEIQTGGDTQMTYISLNYVVWDETKCPIFFKNFKTTPKDKKSHDEKIDFGGKFDKPPKFFFSFTELNLKSTKNVRIASEVKELTKDHALVNVNTWEDESIFHQLGLICLALPDINQLYWASNY
jgi:hypothetical protein